MNIGVEDKKKLGIVVGMGALIIAVGIYEYNSFFGGPSTPLPQPAVAAAPAVPVTSPAAAPAGAVAGQVAPASGGKSAVKVATTKNGQLDPTLHMGGMLAAESLVYTGTGRNIFASGPSQALLEKVAEVKPKFTPRPTTTATLAPIGPPPLPPINLKFFGTATQLGVRRALLLSGEDVFLASPGDIVQRRYKIVSIAANSITVEDLPNSNKQNLPLVAN